MVYAPDRAVAGAVGSGHRRRSDPDRIGLQPPRRRSVRGLFDQSARCSTGAGRDDADGLLRGAAGGCGGHRLRAARSTNPAQRLMTSESLLQVEDLGVSFATEEGVVRAVDGV